VLRSPTSRFVIGTDPFAMAPRRDPYARLGKQSFLAVALTFSCVAVAASIGLPVLAAQSGGHAPAQTPQSAVATARQRVRELEQQLVSVQDAASASASVYSSANARVALLTEEIRTNRAELAQTKIDIVSARAALRQRVLTLYADPPPSVMEVLLMSGSIPSALDSYDLMQHIAGQDSALVNQFTADRDRLTTLGQSLHSDAQSAIADRAIAAQNLAQLRGLAQQRSGLLATATGVLNQAEASAAQVAAVAQASARAKAAASANASSHQIVGSLPHSGGHVSPPGSVSFPTGLSGILARIAACESGGNPAAISPSGLYRGMYQFTYSTWASVGGSGDPAAASAAEQTMRAAILYQRSGPGQWPVCGA